MYNYCLKTGTGLYLPQKWRAVIIIKQWVCRKTISRFRVPWEFLRKRVRGGLLRKLLPFPLCPFYHILFVNPSIFFFLNFVSNPAIQFWSGLRSEHPMATTGNKNINAKLVSFHLNTSEFLIFDFFYYCSLMRFAAGSVLIC